MSSPVPPGVVGTPQGPVPAITPPNVQDYPRLVATLPYFAPVAIAEIIQPSVNEACQAILPTLVPPYVDSAANAAVQNLAVQLVGSTMTGPLMLSPAIPTANTMAATKQYVDTMVATSVPEVPAVPSGQAWARETGQWVPLASGGTVTSIATGAGLTGGPISTTGTISMANMAANTLKGNNTGAAAAPIDLNVGQVMSLLGAAPLASPVFTGTPVLPVGSTGVTQPPTTSNTTLATTAFVASGFVPIPGGTMTGPLTINQAGAPPQPNPTIINPGLQVIDAGAGGGNTAIVLDSYGGSGAPGSAPSNLVYTRFARGTPTAPSSALNGDLLFFWGMQAYAGTAYSPFNIPIRAQAVENWTAAAQGYELIMSTNPAGNTSGVSSLVLSGNTASFSGTVGAAEYTAGAGYRCQAGSGGAATGNVSNIQWVGTAHLWIDTADQGAINTTPCDVRLKKNLEAPTVDALAAINAIALQQFDWLETSLTPEHHEDIGFTAQQLNDAIPNAVYPKDDSEAMWSVQLTPIVAHLIGAVQQLSAKVAALEGRL